MKQYAPPAWLDCQDTGCHKGIAVDPRHVDNLTASGGWYCRDHENEVAR